MIRHRRSSAVPADPEPDRCPEPPPKTAPMVPVLLLQFFKQADDFARSADRITTLLRRSPDSLLTVPPMALRPGKLLRAENTGEPSGFLCFRKKIALALPSGLGVAKQGGPSSTFDQEQANSPDQTGLGRVGHALAAWSVATVVVVAASAMIPASATSVASNLVGPSYAASARIAYVSGVPGRETVGATARSPTRPRSMRRASTSPM